MNKEWQDALLAPTSNQSLTQTGTSQLRHVKPPKRELNPRKMALQPPTAHLLPPCRFLPLLHQQRTLRTPVKSIPTTTWAITTLTTLMTPTKPTKATTTRTILFHLETILQSQFNIRIRAKPPPTPPSIPNSRPPTAPTPSNVPPKQTKPLPTSNSNKPKPGYLHVSEILGLMSEVDRQYCFARLLVERNRNQNRTSSSLLSASIHVDSHSDAPYSN